MDTDTGRIIALLDILGIGCNSDDPTGIVVAADEDLPYGWVRVSDDYDRGYIRMFDLFESLHILNAKNETEPVDSDEFWQETRKYMFDKHPVDHEWPAELLSLIQIQEGGINDNPDHLLILSTNAGIRYVAGPNGVSVDALWEWHNSGREFATSPHDAVQVGCSRTGWLEQYPLEGDL